MSYFYSILVFIAGMGLATQVGVNYMLSKSSSQLWASTISFAVGTVFLLAITFITKNPIPSLTTLSKAPFWVWSGGLLGALYVTIAIFAVPKIGAASLISLVVAGQLFLSLLLDHYGFAGFPTQHISMGRIAGVLFIIAGVILIKKY